MTIHPDPNYSYTVSKNQLDFKFNFPIGLNSNFGYFKIIFFINKIF